MTAPEITRTGPQRGSVVTYHGSLIYARGWGEWVVASTLGGLKLVNLSDPEQVLIHVSRSSIHMTGRASLVPRWSDLGGWHVVFEDPTTVELA